MKNCSCWFILRIEESFNDFIIIKLFHTFVFQKKSFSKGEKKIELIWRMFLYDKLRGVESFPIKNPTLFPKNFTKSLKIPTRNQQKVINFTHISWKSTINKTLKINPQKMLTNNIFPTFLQPQRHRNPNNKFNLIYHPFSFYYLDFHQFSLKIIFPPTFLHLKIFINLFLSIC